MFWLLYTQCNGNTSVPMVKPVSMYKNMLRCESTIYFRTLKYCLKMPLRSYSQNTPIQICQIKIFLYLRSVFFQTKPVLMFGHFFKMSTHSTEDVNA